MWSAQAAGSYTYIPDEKDEPSDGQHRQPKPSCRRAEVHAPRSMADVDKSVMTCVQPACRYCGLLDTNDPIHRC